MITMTDLCHECRNWFDKERLFGDFTIENGVLANETVEKAHLQTGQYYRIIGSVFNDGVHQHPDESLKDETFDGAIWTMAVPPGFEGLLGDINSWLEEHGQEADSPYQSESFAGYSYTMKSGADGQASGAVGLVLAQFASVLNRWRKIR